MHVFLKHLKNNLTNFIIIINTKTLHEHETFVTEQVSFTYEENMTFRLDD